MEENLKISIVIPCYNCEKYIKETIKSVLNQSYKDFEIIAVDDCSTDNTYNILKNMQISDSRIKVHKNHINIGVAETRNIGVEIARSEFIAFLDSDDSWYKDKLKTQINFMIRNNISISSTGYELWNGDMTKKIRYYNIPVNITYERLLNENFIGLSTVIIKKDIFQKFKMNSKYIHEDYALWLRLLRNNYKIIGINQPLGKYRVLDSSRNANKIRSLIGRIEILYFQEKIGLFSMCKYIVNCVIRGYRKYRKN